MEDKSHLYPDGAEFRAPTEEDQEEPEEKKDKKNKKKGFVEWLKENVFKEEPKIEDEVDGEKEPSRVQRFVDSLKGWLNPVSGVEKDEVFEPTEAEGAEFQPAVHLPIFAEFSETLHPLDDAVSDEEDTDGSPVVRSVAEVQGEPGISGVEHTDPVEVPGAPESISVMDTHDTEAIDIEVPEEDGLIDREIPEPVVRSELRSDPDAGIVERPVENTTTERETIVEKRNGGGAALLGFVAGEVLSRSRDAKLRKEGQELKKQVNKIEETQNFHETQQVEVDKAARRNKEQIEKLKQKRQADIAKDANAERLHKEPKAYPIEAAPRPEPKELGRQEPAQEKRRSEVRPEVAAIQNQVETEAQKNIVLEQIKQAAEKDIALEGYYERRHEAKDVPTSSAPASPSLGQGGAKGFSQQAAEDDRVQLQQNIQRLQNDMRGHQSLYKQAVKQGAWTGIILLVAFLAFVFIWSLL